jgi:uncharacterized protein (TIGR02246 family)
MRTILTCAAILACAACNQTTPASAPKAGAAADSQALDQMEAAQITAVNAHDLAGATAPYAEDAVFINERGEASKGRDSITAAFKGFVTDPALKMDYHPGAKTMSQSGDVAYSTSEFTETYTDPATKKPVTIKGTNLSVWRKQADGSWKLVADSNPAATTG